MQQEYYYKLYINEINNLKNDSIREHLKKLYELEARSLLKNTEGIRITKDDSLNDILLKTQDYFDQITSYVLFYGDYVKFYPNIKECIAQKNHNCCFSNALIRKGSLYVRFKPFLHNISKNEKYVANKVITVEPGYLYDLPKTLSDFEDFYSKVISHTSNQDLDYSNISYNLSCEYKILKLKNSK